MFKNVVNSPEWLETDAVVDVYSLSGCISKCFTDYIDYWRHNGHWLFDSPEIMEDLSKEMNLDLSGATLFYYEMHEYEYDGNVKDWAAISTELPFETNVRVPMNKYLQGFDVVSFTFNSTPECSPLSCNALAKEIPVNRHCLFNTFDEAKQSLEKGLFKNSEPGPYRIFAIYTSVLV